MVAVKGTRVGKGQRTNQKVHAGRYVHDEAYNEEQHDMGPWIEVTSTRVDAIRYDYQNRAIQVLWANKGRERGLHLHRRALRALPRLRPCVLEGQVRQLVHDAQLRVPADDPDELDAPTNERRSSLGMTAADRSAASVASARGDSHFAALVAREATEM